MALEPLIKGDYEIVDFVVMEPDPDTEGAERERDVTNDSFTFVAKRQPKDELAVITKTDEAGEGITITDAANGVGYVEILPEDTDDFTKDTPLACYITGVAPVNKPYTMLFNLKVKYHG